MGGTEIYNPLFKIFNSIKNREQKLKTHIYLLTDGAVDNRDKVISLVKENCINGNIRVHTIGVGNGSD